MSAAGDDRARESLPHDAPSEVVLYPVGAVLGAGYEVLGVLGAGSMGQVYEARDRRLGRVVALKFASGGFADRALLHEASVLATFQHPGLVQVHGLDRHEGRDFIVMERVAGRTLSAHIAQRVKTSSFDFHEAIEILVGIGEALAVLHAAGYAHQDLKPDNIMLAPRGRAVLLDLGIARHEQQAIDPLMMGSPIVMAPEAVLGSLTARDRHMVDIYALGVIAFQLLTGHLPFDGNAIKPLLDAHATSQPPPASWLRPDIPPALERLVLEMLAKRPEDRPAPVDLVVAVLRSIRAALPERELAATLDVLVVDDDPHVRDMMEMMVRQAVPAAQVRLAENGREGLREVHRRPPDVMFLDIDMPVMSGTELCMYLRGTNLTSRTTIVVVSSHAEEEKELLRQLGVADVVTKRASSRIPDLLRRIADARMQVDVAVGI